MSETLDQLAAAPVPLPPPPMPTIRRVSNPDLNEVGPWLLPRIAAEWSTSQQLAKYWLAGAIPSNEQALVICGDAVGMAHIEPGRMGHPCRVIVDFVLSARLTDGVDECVEIYAWLANWARSLGASGLFRVDDFTDADRSFIRGRIGKLTKRESFNAVF